MFPLIVELATARTPLFESIPPPNAPELPEIVVRTIVAMAADSPTPPPAPALMFDAMVVSLTVRRPLFASIPPPDAWRGRRFARCARSARRFS